MDMCPRNLLSQGQSPRNDIAARRYTLLVARSEASALSCIIYLYYILYLQQGGGGGGGGVGGGDAKIFQKTLLPPPTYVF